MSNLCDQTLVTPELIARLEMDDRPEMKVILQAIQRVLTAKPSNPVDCGYDNRHWSHSHQNWGVSP